MSKLGKRAGPDPVDPIAIGGIRYEAPHWGKELGVEQNGGYIAAYDESTSERLWILRVYEAVYDSKRERDVQDVFITRLSVDEADGELRVEDEDGRTFKVDRQSRSVS